MSEAIYHRRYQEPDKVDDDGNEIEWPVPFWWIDVGATMQNIMLAAVNEGLGSGFAGRRHRRDPGVPRHPGGVLARSASCRWAARSPTSAPPA